MEQWISAMNINLLTELGYGDICNKTTPNPSKQYDMNSN